MNISNNRSLIVSLALIGGLGFSNLVIAEDRMNEVPATGPIPFVAFDTNNDGVISATEYSNARAMRQTQQAKTGKPHIGSRQAPTFTEIDKNGDQQITKQELAVAQKMKQGQNKPMQQPLSLTTPKQTALEQGIKRPRKGRMPTFNEFDLDKNGQISEQELTKAREMRQAARQQNGKGRNQKQPKMSFAEIDNDHNGSLSPDEFKEHQLQQRLNY